MTKTGKILFFFQCIQRLMEADTMQEYKGFKMHLGSWYNKGLDFEKKMSKRFEKNGMTRDDFDEDTYVIFDILDEVVRLNPTQRQKTLEILINTNNAKSI